ncbi:UGT85A1 [Acrasis kona]|uniref:UGT85A1 n=1 Tax=Acrasis kona TaxID=1008807 RepID=A0AAW2ZA41_9EUKA
MRSIQVFVLLLLALFVLSDDSLRKRNKLMNVEDKPAPAPPMNNVGPVYAISVEEIEDRRRRGMKLSNLDVSNNIGANVAEILE